VEAHQPIQFIVPYALGGGSAVLARSIGNIWGEALTCTRDRDQPGRGNGTIGMTSAAQSKGNQHMLMTFISGQATASLVAGKGIPTFRTIGAVRDGGH
jgi:tripartite-type tricarboxylate transporter receptor subunit TctC